MKILIVEDNSGKLRRIQTILQKYGLEYDVAMTGKDALRLESEHRYDFAVLDIEFPWNEHENIVGHPGLEIMRAFDKKKSDIQVIVYSNVPVEEIWKKTGEKPANCFVIQAVFPFQLENAIKLQLKG